MKDSEQRELFRELIDYVGTRTTELIGYVGTRTDDLERKIEAATATIVGGNLKEMVERIHDNQDSIERIHKSLDRIQELTERPASEGRKLFDAAIRETEEKLRREQLEQIKVIPSPSVPAIVGMSVGAIIFLVGMFVAWVLLR